MFLEINWGSVLQVAKFPKNPEGSTGQDTGLDEGKGKGLMPEQNKGPEDREGHGTEGGTRRNS